MRRDNRGFTIEPVEKQIQFTGSVQTAPAAADHFEAGNQLHPPPHAFDVIQLAFGLPVCIFTPSPPCFQFILCDFRVILVPRLEDHLLWPSFHWRSCTLDTPSDVLPALKAPFILLMRPPALAQQCSNHKSEQKLPPREREMWCLEKMHLNISCSNTPDT